MSLTLFKNLKEGKKRKKSLYILSAGMTLGAAIGVLAISGAIDAQDWRGIIMLLPHALITGVVFGVWISLVFSHASE